MNSKELTVSISLDNEVIKVGKLWFNVRGNRESASFEYDKKWLQHPEKFALEPALKLTEGTFHTSQGLSIFGSIGDSAPDRWGRTLIRRYTNLSSNNKTLFEVDYLLGVSDESRQGALRFSATANEGVFLSTENFIPPLIELPKLLTATERIIAEDERAEDLQLLLAPGASLGGARPKASIRDKNGDLAIAKFSRQNDEFNVVAWEAITLNLAAKSGINVPSYRLEKICDKSVLIVNRFDRVGEKRIPFLSAMSMLDARDNEEHCYLEIAYALSQNGACPEEDMKELWRRIVFTIMVSNTDDHLRNHGFIYQRNKGWRLSPAYDINPTPRDIAPHNLTTSINFDDNSASLEIAMHVAKDFRLNNIEAKKIIKEVTEAVKTWRGTATSFGLSKKEIDRMSSAFETK